MTDHLIHPPTQTELDSLESVRTASRARLSQRAIGSDLTLDEYAERADAIERATTEAELNAAVRGLAEDQIEVPVDPHPRWLVGILGGAEQRGRWRLSSRLRIVAVLGGVTLDLGNAQPEASESVITVIAFMGGVDIIAPPGIPIGLAGISLLGGKSDKRPSGDLLPGAPTILVRAFALMGGVGVKQRSSRRGAIEMIRGRRARPSENDHSNSAAN